MAELVTEEEREGEGGLDLLGGPEHKEDILLFPGLDICIWLLPFPKSDHCAQATFV